MAITSRPTLVTSTGLGFRVVQKTVFWIDIWPVDSRSYDFMKFISKHVTGVVAL